MEHFLQTLQKTGLMNKRRNISGYLLFTIMVLTVGTVYSQPYRKVDNTAFGHGEKLTFRVYYH